MGSGNSRCPFCGTDIAAGATVCRGCGAEREYRKVNWRILAGGICGILGGLICLGSGVPGAPVLILIGIGLIGCFIYTCTRRGYSDRWVRRSVQ